jgi:hypothetical protein
MAEETRQLTEHIEMERDKLGRNFEEVESHIKTATDPKAWFDSNPALYLGAAAAGGVVLGLLLTPPKNKGFEDVEPVYATGSTPRPHLNAVREVVDITLGALIGMGTRKVQDLISQVLPGFQEQYDEARRRQTH